MRDLSVRAGDLPLVHGVSFDLSAGERVGLIGESGSGKSLTALAVMGLLGKGLTAQGQVLFEGQDLMSTTEKRRCQLRGNGLSMVFQEPMTALNPTMRVGRQIGEVLRVHRNLGKRAAREQARGLMERVDIPDPVHYERHYPHQLSGGQRQRIMLAMATACEPSVILADEPTTALDVTVQSRMLELMRKLVAEQNSALLLITHDLAVVSEMSDRILTMYGGHIVESGSTKSLLDHPRHPYTSALVATSNAVTVDSKAPAGALPMIEGSVPATGQFPTGCPFRDRCPRADEKCAVMPPLEPLGDQVVACWHPVPENAGDPASRVGA
ncbi:ABC transporter ATP-binding protein [Leekyejoonella antrihumi]|uniref:ABC transporter ATP-binding protein n=1 Tax=Leekyejoonella antrihumi TaxID=1660198 RepID=UPI001C93EBC8|nr:ABC transporter ATP-binding protein [Leekyejoonella antrihumi]